MPGPVVTNCSTSRMSQDLADKYGVSFACSKVGEANVADMMIKHNAIFGGEGNGGPIDPRIGYVRDSFVGMAYCNLVFGFMRGATGAKGYTVGGGLANDVTAIAGMLGVPLAIVALLLVLVGAQKFAKGEQR